LAVSQGINAALRLKRTAERLAGPRGAKVKEGRAPSIGPEKEAEDEEDEEGVLPMGGEDDSEEKDDPADSGEADQVPEQLILASVGSYLEGTDKTGRDGLRQRLDAIFTEYDS